MLQSLTACHFMIAFGVYSAHTNLFEIHGTLQILLFFFKSYTCDGVSGQNIPIEFQFLAVVVVVVVIAAVVEAGVGVVVVVVRVVVLAVYVLAKQHTQ